jgi:hypothetical protein
MSCEDLQPWVLCNSVRVRVEMMFDRHTWTEIQTKELIKVLNCSKFDPDIIITCLEHKTLNAAEQLLIRQVQLRFYLDKYPLICYNKSMKGE